MTAPWVELSPNQLAPPTAPPAPFTLPTILTESGGGIFGVGPANYVVDVEATAGKAIQALVQALAGTSAGSINTGMYGCGYTGAQVKSFYPELTPAFFGHKLARYTYLKCGPQYDDTVLLQVLKEKCGDRTMSETVLPTYITAWDVTKHCLKVFGPGDKAVPVWYAIRASMAAPSFFGILDGIYGDGGLCANDPLIVGFAGVVTDDSVDFSRGLKLLNLVTSGTTADGDKASNRWFILTLLEKVILPAITAGNSSDVEFIRGAIDKFTRVLAGSHAPLLRNFRVAPVSPNWNMDAVDKSDAIAKIWTDQFAKDKDSLLTYLSN